MRAELRRILALLVAVLSTACNVRSATIRDLPDVRPQPGQPPVAVRSPIKAHLLDGRTIVFAEGADVGRDSIWGRGASYDVALQHLGSVGSVPLDSVVALEAFGYTPNVPASVAGSLLGTVGGLALTGLLAVAIFGSCPTVYADSAGHQVLQAETFSYSIAPVFEMRDVDPLSAQPDGAGRLTLEVRDEALETHYINQLELLEVARPSDGIAAPDPSGRPIALEGGVPPAESVDRAGRDVRRVLRDADGVVYQTAPDVLARADASDPDDTLEMSFPISGASDSAALHLRVRNSLLLTVLFYRVMLADVGARSLDWMHRDLDRIGPAVELGHWVAANLGMRLEVWDGTEWRPAGHVPDTGPIAWKDIAVLVPIPEGVRDTLRVRATFPADAWRIDQVAASTSWSRPTERHVPLETVVDAAGTENREAAARLSAPDGQYLILLPGQRFEAVFRPGTTSGPESSRSYFLASQGYYTEWVRRSWLAGREGGAAFRPGPAALAEAERLWRAGRDTLEARFYSSRLPVR